MRSLTRSQASGTRACAWTSTTAVRRPPTTISRRLRLAPAFAAVCGGLGAKPMEESAQQQPAKIMPAVVPDTLFRNSLRVGMVDSHFFADFNFRLALADGPTYTPESAWKEWPCCRRVESSGML